MPLLGAIGNASEYSFRGTYDNYPFELDFGDIVGAKPGEIYYSPFLSIEDINYKVPISIVGDGEYTLIDDTFDLTFDNQQIELDSQVFSFDADKPIYPYTNLPGYVRNKNKVGIRIYGIPPVEISDTLTVDLQSSESVDISLDESISIDLRDGTTTTFSPNGTIELYPQTTIGAELYDKTYSTTITIGKKSFTWKVTTKGVPGPLDFRFDDAINVPTSTDIISNSYTVRGLSDEIDYIAKILGDYPNLSVNGGDFIKFSTIKNGDTIRLKRRSSRLDNATIGVALSIETASTPITKFRTDWFVVTGDYTPDSVTFTAVSSAELNSFIKSVSRTITGLTNGIDYNVEITSSDGLLSVDGGGYVKSQVIRNGQTLSLGLQTTSKFLESKNISVKVAKSTFTWKVVNRDVLPNIDSNADKLLFAIPYDNTFKFRDASTRVRQYNNVSLPTNQPNAGYYTNPDSSLIPTIVSDQSKFYTHSQKIAVGDGVITGGNSYVYSHTRINRNDFTFECWFYPTSYTFSSRANNSMWIAVQVGEYASDGIGFVFTNDSWLNGRGLISIQRISPSNTTAFVSESNRSIPLNTWSHIAITRKSDVFTIYINGIASGSVYSVIDIDRDYYNFLNTPFEASTKETYIQDVRMYNGLVKYTSNFDVSTVSSILERYDENGSLESSQESSQLCKSSGSEKNYPTNYCGWYTRTGLIESNPYTNIRQLVIIWNGVIVYDGNGVTSGGISVGEYTYFPGDKVGDSLYGWNNDHNNAFDVYREENLYVDPAGRILILSCSTPGKDPRTLSKITWKVLPDTDTCIDDVRWQSFLSLASSEDYRLAVTLNNSTTRIVGATKNNIRKMIDANRKSLSSSLTSWDSWREYIRITWDEISGDDGTGLDYSGINWDSRGFGYYGDSSNPPFESSSYFHQTANWWILPPGVPDF